MGRLVQNGPDMVQARNEKSPEAVTDQVGSRSPSFVIVPDDVPEDVPDDVLEDVPDDDDDDV